MKKRKLIAILYIVLVIGLNFPIYIRKAKADVIFVYSSGTGNFLPVEDVPLSMTNATVCFNIDTTTYSSRINLDFKGNYTIYNPIKSLNTTLVAPFSPEFKGIETSSVIKIMNTTISYGFLEYRDTNSPWDEYLDLYYFASRKFLVINVTIPENDSITIEYSFDAYIEIMQSFDELMIFYDVGTSRAWNGTITEHVEYNVYGKLPDRYSSYRNDFFEYNCTISDIGDGTCYAWDWENETINAYSVYILYSYFIPWLRWVPFILFPSLLLGSVIIGLLIKRIRKRKTQIKMYNLD